MGWPQYRPSVAETVRAFVALDPPETQRALLAAHLRACQAIAPDYRWVAPEALHLTLRFIGHVPPAGLERITADLERVRAGRFRLALGAVGAFGTRSSPRVVWLGLGDGAGPCAALAAAIEAACRAAGMEPESRPFRPHLTLARARADGARLPALPEAPPLDPWTVEDFVLYESRLQPRGGAGDTGLRRFPLRP